jgi:CheY-like chemotaxis protein
LGIGTYLIKPIQQSRLLEAVERVLGRQSLDTAPKAHSSAGHTVVARTVLLVEDNVVNQRVARELLRKRGHSVVVANNGAEALASLEREAFDVILMDVQMPVMGGFEATAAIRDGEKTTGRHQRIVAMTAHAMTGDRERCVAAGMDGYLSKPIQPSMLFAAVERDEPVSTGTASELAAKGDAPVSAGAGIRSDASAIQAFLIRCPASLASMRRALERRDVEAARSESNTIKRLASGVSATGLFDAAQVVEQLSDQRRFDAATAAWRQLSMHAANVFHELQKFTPL